MKIIKSLFACLLVLAMVVPMFVITSFADPATGDIPDHWVTLGAKYSQTSFKIIAKDGVVNDTNFTFTQNAAGGIDVVIPPFTARVSTGACGTVVVTNKYTCPLEDLDIQMHLADDAKFEIDTKGALGTYSFAWLDQPITEIGFMDRTSEPRGIYTSEQCSTNGIRQIGNDTKKGLYVIVGSASIYSGTKQAGYVSIYMFDGKFKDAVDGEGGWGYRWTFTSRNGEGPLGDVTEISRNYIHDLDLADGLRFQVRSDSVLGYVVSVNGTEYYQGKGENCVAYFPNNTAGSGGGGSWLDADFVTSNPNWVANMNYLREDIDLSALKSVKQGYVTISATAPNLQVPHCNFTIDTINGEPAATFGSGSVNPPSGNPFTDVPAGKWFTDPCLYCYEKAYMAGIDGTTFNPGGVMNRAQFVTILSKIDESDTSSYNDTPFNDVPAGKWYSKPVAWAYKMGYAGGTGNGNFSPMADVTRETLATFFRTYAEKKGYDVSASADLSKYADNAQVAKWAATGMSWAVGVGIISGTSETMLSPKNNATRAQVAVIVRQFVTSVVPAADGE